MRAEEYIVTEMLAWFEDSEHWAQNYTTITDRDGQVVRTCLVGGMDHVTDQMLECRGTGGPSIRVLETLAETILEQYPDGYWTHEALPQDVIITFNDDCGTKVEDVRAILEKTCARFREGGS